MAEEKQQQDLFNDSDISFLNEASDFISSKFEEEEETTEEIEEVKEEENIDGNEGEVVEESKEEKETPSSQETSKDSSRLTPYFKLLVEEGEFSNEDFEKWDGTSEGLVNLRYEKRLEDWNKFKDESLDPRVKWLQDNLEEGVPLEDLLQLDKQTVSLDKITEEDLAEKIDLQKRVAEQYYKETTRFSDDRIQREIKRLEDSGELETESPTFFKELKTILDEKKTLSLEQARKQREQQQQEQQKALDDFKSSLNKTEEIIPGIKLNNIIRDRLFKTLTTPVAVDDQGAPLNKIAKARAEDPMGFEMKLGYLFELTNGFTDWSPLGASGKKQALKNFEEAASELDRKSSGSKQNIPQNMGDADFLKELDKLHNKGII